MDCWSSPFELLIAVLLSAQATDVSVNKATDKLFPVANTPKSILDLGVDGLKEYIKTIGLFNSKAENTIKTCKILLEKHNGRLFWIDLNGHFAIDDVIRRHGFTVDGQRVGLRIEVVCKNKTDRCTEQFLAAKSK